MRRVKTELLHLKRSKNKFFVRFAAFFTLLFFFLSAGHLSAQTGPKLSAQFQDAPLADALRQLSREYNLIIAFDPGKMAGHSVSVAFKDQSLAEALDQLLKDQPFVYEILGPDQAVIRPASSTDPPPAEPTQSLTLQVLDATTGEPLEYATVRTRVTGAYTGPNGQANLQIRPTQDEQITVSYIGYEPQTFPLASPIPSILNVSLQPAFTPMEDIVIEDRSHLPVSPAGKNEAVTVNTRELEALSFLGESDLFRTLQWAPGISGATESAAGLEIRGGTADQNLVLLDGMEIYNSGHFSGMFNAFNAHALNQARTIRGGFGADYGGRISGVIDLSGAPEVTDSLRFGVSANLLNVNGYASIPLVRKKAHLFVATRRSYSDIVASPFYSSISDNLFQSGDTFQDTTDLDDEGGGIEVEPLATFYDLHAKLVTRPSDRDQLSLTWYQGGDLIDYSYSLLDSEFTRTTLDQLRPTNLGGSLNWTRQWSAHISSYANASYSSFKSSYANSQTFTEEDDTTFSEFRQQTEVNTWKGEAGVNWHFLPQHQLKTGIQFNHHQTPILITTREDDNRNTDSILTAGWLGTLYVQDVYQPFKNLTLRGGLRTSWFSTFDELHWEPRISALYEPVPGLAFKGAWGQYYQFLNPARLDNQLKLGETFFVLADEELEIEVLNSRHSILGVSYQAPGFWAEAEFYHKSLTGLQTFTSRYDAAQSSPQPEDLLTNGSGTIIGMDLFLRKQWGRYTGWVAYTLSQAEYEFQSIDSAQSFPADQDHRHELKLVNIMDFDPFQVTLTWIYASGRPYTRAIGIDTTDGGEDLIFGPNNSSRLPAYHRMDFSFLYKFRIKKWGRASTGLTVFNLYNRENIRDRNYSLQPSAEDEDELEIIRVDRELLRISPNVFFTLEF